MSSDPANEPSPELRFATTEQILDELHRRRPGGVLLAWTDGEDAGGLQRSGLAWRGCVMHAWGLARYADRDIYNQLVEIDDDDCG